MTLWSTCNFAYELSSLNRLGAVMSFFGHWDHQMFHFTACVPSFTVSRCCYQPSVTSRHRGAGTRKWVSVARHGVQHRRRSPVALPEDLSPGKPWRHSQNPVNVSFSWRHYWNAFVSMNPTSLRLQLKYRYKNIRSHVIYFNLYIIYIRQVRWGGFFLLVSW